MTCKKLTATNLTAIPTIYSPATASVTIVRKELLDIATATIVNALAHMEKQIEAVLNAGSSTQAYAS